MKLNQLLLPATALGAVVLLFGTDASLGFNTLPGTLSLSQRDVRVFDNFSDASANNNTTADPNWPGYTGAELAIWKACSEWSSQLHGGTGAGDPLQTVGSGGANFDISWQGNANGIGGLNDNIHSEDPTNGGGVLAYCWGGVADGWQIRYHANWTWQDGPGSVSGGIDIQGVAAHEYGHALGLDHTNVGGSTMFASISGTGTGARSIEADDIAGVQFKYGVKSASKPTISSLSVNAGQVTINGSNFSPSNNEVWFTQAATGGTGNPIKVTGVTSNGSSITVAIPGTAGEGDVLVRNNGTAHTNLSNAWPFDPGAAPPTCGATVYCTAKVSSNLCIPSIGFSGTPSFFSAAGFSITTTGMEAGVSAINFFGTTGQATVPFQGGLICAGSPIYRLNGKNTGGAGTCTGSVTYTLQDVINHGAGGPFVTVGGLVNIQSWGRDLGDPFGSSLSNALQIVVCP
jgi:hypothetical protein